MPFMVKRLPKPAAWRCSVALVGMDGSGKSTQAGWLARKVKAERVGVLLIHPFGRKILSFLPDHLSAGSNGTGRRSGRSRLAQLAAVVEMLDIGLYIWAAYIRAFALALRVHHPVCIVSDRAFDDLLVKHRRLGTFSPRVLAAARRLAPVPEKTIWLHTEPDIAAGRDGDFEPAYYQELHATYTYAAAQYGWDIVRTSNRSSDAVAADIERLLGLRRDPAPVDGRERLDEDQAANGAKQPEARIDDVRQS